MFRVPRLPGTPVGLSLEVVVLDLKFPLRWLMRDSVVSRLLPFPFHFIFVATPQI